MSPVTVDVLRSSRTVPDTFARFKKKMQNFSTDVHESPQYKISRKSVRWGGAVTRGESDERTGAFYGDLMSSERIKCSSCKVRDILPDFNQIWVSSTDLHRSSQYQISGKFFQWEPL
jgi:hypothetical protein